MSDNFLYVQAQNFSLYGAGASLGATTLILQSFAQINGTLLTMTDFGSIGFGTLEPGNGTLEEQISFTGVTQNTNGTATLTGVSTVSMVSPYTASSGLAQTHAGATTFVISNTSGFYDRLAGKADDETITGKWTFPDDDTNRARILSDTDTAVATAFVTLGQLSRQAISGASNASTTVKGIVQLPTQAQVDAKTATGSTSALLALTPDKQRSTQLSDYVVDTGAADAYAIAPSPAITAYAAGQTFTFKAAHTNTTASTLAVSGLPSPKAIKKLDGATALIAGDIVAGQIITVEYDGTNFQMTSPVGYPPVILTGGAYPAGNGAAITGLTGFPLVYKLNTGVSYASSTSENAVFTAAVPGGTLSTVNAVRFKIFVSVFRLSNTKTATFKLKYGSTTMVTIVITNSFGGDAPGGMGIIEGFLLANASASSQNAFLSLDMSGQGTTLSSTFGGGTMTNDTGTATEVSSGALNLVLTVQFNNSSASDTLVTRFTVVDKIQAA